VPRCLAPRQETRRSALLSGPDPKPVDVCSHGFGVRALNSLRKEQNFVVIPAQSPVPAHGEDTFNTVEEGQTSRDRDE